MASCQAARMSGAAATGSGPIGSAGWSWPDSSRQASMELARRCQSRPVQGVARDWAEGVDRPWQGVGGGVLADPVLARVHHRGDFGGVGAAFGVGDCGDLRGPEACGERDEGPGPVAEAVVDDGGHVSGSGQVRSAIAAARTPPASRPASSAARMVRHSHRPWWPGSRRYPGGRLVRSRSR
jgi:hypothetical protein